MRWVRRKRRINRSPRTSTGRSRIKIITMLNEGVADGKQSAAGAQRQQAGIGKRGEASIELGKFCPRHRNVRASEIGKCRMKPRFLAESRRDPAKVNDLGPDRQR